VETADDDAVEEVVTAETTESCIDCHNDTTLILAREVQWSASLHGSGMTFERNGANCATCHTSEGFTERMTTGTFEIAEDIENPSPINCRTCHNIHDTNTSADWALTSSEAVTFELTGDIYDLGNSNLCVNCHQPRPADVPVVGGGDYEITSTRFGPHHGPQSSMLAGVGGYGEEYTGSNVHYDSVDNGCITCHMSDAYGKQAGGHTMNVTYEYHGATEESLSSCIACHEDIESFDRDGVQTEIEELLEEVHVLLVAQGLIDGESGSGLTGTFTSEQAGALWNYKTIEEDRSMGVHNPKFAKFLLETALEALE
jgi:nitrate/TMAO reductase-like tetraheme cytochrome c subunit